MSDILQNRRRTGIELLELLASENEQLDYERNVPFIDITFELRCMWFDDFYDPKYAESDAAFSPSEREALANFNEVYSQRVDRLPLSDGTIRTWLNSPVWREVMLAAQHALNQMRR